MRNLWVAALALAFNPRSCAAEVVVNLKNGKRLGLSTTGPSAFRVRFLDQVDGDDEYAAGPGLESPMVRPDEPDAAFTTKLEGDKVEIEAHFGSLAVSRSASTFTLLNAAKTVITQSQPIDMKLEDMQLKLSASTAARLYGRGASEDDAGVLLLSGVNSPAVENKKSFVPHYFCTDGYAALAAVDRTVGQVKDNGLAASYELKDGAITWTTKGHFELYLMPADSLDRGTQAYFKLIGPARVPPLYAFGFIASRWGWKDSKYIKETLEAFRSGSFPIDAIIGDFEWFTNVSDYTFPPEGFPWYSDFGYGKATFPDPQAQFKEYLKDYKIHFGGIRKPRLGNTAMLQHARDKGWLLPGEEAAAQVPSEPYGYAQNRNLNYTKPDVRSWYIEKQKHYYDDGVSFWWNDEGETSYFTFHWWNEAHVKTLQEVDPTRRYFALNRAFTPGMARLGATVWTGDIHNTWEDLQKTPGFMLNWALAGAPYVGCDTGGFFGNTTGQLLTRWMQVAAFMPIMRVHSTLEAVPHFPFLFPDYAAVLREALNIRYRLAPYHYSLAHKMYETQLLWMRPLFAEFPADAATANLASQWMDGDLLVAPVLREDGSKDIYLPSGQWYLFNSSKIVTGPANITGKADIGEIPVFARPGTIVPLAPIVQSTADLPGGPLEVQVYTGANGSFTLVEDDGSTNAYESGAVRKITFTVTDLESSTTLSWEVSGHDNASPLLFKQLYVRFFAPTGISTGSLVDIHHHHSFVTMRSSVDSSRVTVIQV